MNNNETVKRFLSKQITPIGMLNLMLCLLDIVEICQNAKYPEDLEDIYDVLDKYCPSWKGAKK